MHIFSLIIGRAAPSTGIGIGIGPIPAFFGGIGIGKACYTSTNSVVDTLYVLYITMNFYNFLSVLVK